MYRVADHPTRAPIPWLWRRPERVATLAFMVGTLASASALGVAANSAETQGYGLADVARISFFLGFTALTTAIPVVFWGLVIRIALWLRGGLDVGLIVISAVAMKVLTLFTVIVASGHHGQSTALQSALGLIVAVFLDALRLTSFFGVAKLAQRVHDGDADQGPRDVAAAAWAWALAFSLIGTLVGPGVAFKIPAALVLLPCLAGLVRVHAVVSRGVGEQDAAQARARARATVLRGLRTGALPLALAGALFVPVRLYEQITTTRNPAQIAIFKSGIAHSCEVRDAGREGGVSLWLIDCTKKKNFTIGWDEREHVLLRDEQLFARVPRLRPAAPQAHEPAALSSPPATISR